MRNPALPVQRVSERVDDAPDEFLAHRHTGRFAGAPDGAALHDEIAVSEQNAADPAAVQLQHHAADVRLEEQDFPVSRVFQPGHHRDPVRDGNHLAGLLGQRGRRPVLQRLRNQRDDRLRGGFCPAELVEIGVELLEQALLAPVVDMRTHLQPEAVPHRAVLDPFQFDALAVFAAQEGDKAVGIRLFGRLCAVKPCRARFFVIRHRDRPFPPRRGTDGTLRPCPS